MEKRVLSSDKTENEEALGITFSDSADGCGLSWLAGKWTTTDRYSKLRILCLLITGGDGVVEEEREREMSEEEAGKRRHHNRTGHNKQ